MVIFIHFYVKKKKRPLTYCGEIIDIGDGCTHREVLLRQQQQQATSAL